MALHIPVLRRGRAYRSVEVTPVPHFRTGETVAEVGQANPGLVRRDLLPEAQAAMGAALADVPVRRLLAICGDAAHAFLHDTLPAGQDAQTPDDYVRQVSATTGLPHVLVRRNMEKIRGVLEGAESVLGGLTRGLDLDVLDRGLGHAQGRVLSFVRRSPTLGIVLPSNSPGVHALWAPTPALKTALVLKPGSAEPWTPYRVVQAFLRAGAPPEAFGFYPTGHAGAGEILRTCGRGILFGDVGATRAWEGDPRVEVHGPGYSKVLLAGRAADDWPAYLDTMATSVADNGGRSCVNASGIWLTAHAAKVAEALAERLVGIAPRADDDPAAQLAPFANPEAARRISAIIDRGLETPGAVDVTARHRAGGRVVEWEGATYLLPTVVLCDSPGHPLANREFLFPFASVVPVAPADVPSALGPTLAATVIVDDEALRARILSSPLLHRINLGAVPTSQVSWDQPHEGNLFDHLYARRALQGAGGVSA
jgi:acyl-CoA reductase-like NAD-dependent aldehyde dehydrogenase